MMKKIYIIILILVMVFASAGNAQEVDTPLQDVNVDDLGAVTDEFQEHFFEALKQKAIENYEKAIAALQKAEQLQPNNAVIFFELGKNYKLLENYDQALANFQKANRLQPNKEWILVELMETYYFKKDYEEAILVAQNLLPFNGKYYENLANLYFESKQFDKLLDLLDKLDAELGISEFRLSMRRQIYALTENAPAQIQVLKDAINANPENETNYLNLIYVYSDQDLKQEAFATAEEMRKIFPTSKVVHLALYKFYLDAGNTSESLNSMKLVLAAEEIDPESKFKVLNDFLIFVNDNPSYEAELLKVAEVFAASESSPQIYQKFGEYYLQKEQKEKALSFFSLGLNSELDNFELIKNTLLLQVDLQKYEDAKNLSERALEIFPAQPILYLARGVALNNLKEYKAAEEILTFGLDYLIDDQQMMIDFYEQLVIAYTGLNNAGKATEIREKAEKLKKTLN